MLLNPNRTPLSIRGVTLVELMVALVLGLLVSGAVITFVVSTIQANAQMTQTTRLTQELRALGEIITRDVRRARYQADSIQQLGRGDFAEAPYGTVTISEAGDCIQYSYEAPNANERFRAIWLNNGRVLMAVGAAEVPCGDRGGIVLSSPEVAITTLRFGWVGGSTNLAQLELEGQLTGGRYDAVRTFTSSIRIRSVPIDLAAASAGEGG